MSRSPAPPQPSIDRQIHDQHQRAEYELNLVRQRRRIEDGQKVPAQKVAWVVGFSTLCPQPILQWRQRTDPAAEFDEGAPEDGGQMNPENRVPSEGQQSSEQDKEDKCDVEEKHEVGKEPVIHDLAIIGRGNGFILLDDST